MHLTSDDIPTLSSLLMCIVHVIMFWTESETDFNYIDGRNEFLVFLTFEFNAQYSLSTFYIYWFCSYSSAHKSQCARTQFREIWAEQLAKKKRWCDIACGAEDARDLGLGHLCIRNARFHIIEKITVSNANQFHHHIWSVNCIAIHKPYNIHLYRFRWSVQFKEHKFPTIIIILQLWSSASYFEYFLLAMPAGCIPYLDQLNTHTNVHNAFVFAFKMLSSKFYHLAVTIECGRIFVKFERLKSKCIGTQSIRNQNETIYGYRRIRYSDNMCILAFFPFQYRPHCDRIQASTHIDRSMETDADTTWRWHGFY